MVAPITSGLIGFVVCASVAGVAIAQTQAPLRPKESVEADVSTRTVSIEADFVGTEIVVFGTVENSQQPSAEAGTYDVVVIIEGRSTPVVVRRKSSIAGLWINTKSIRFASLPSYYAIASTRPIYDIAEMDVLTKQQIGYEYVRMVEAGSGRFASTDPKDLSEFRHAVVRLKQQSGLYLRRDYGVGFVGRSLFRATIPVPPNVPVGPLSTRVFLFREGELLGQYKSQVTLERTGTERFMYDTAQRRPVLYGLGTVLIAVSAGLAAAFAFRRDT